MAVNIKPIGDIANKWKTVTPARANDYANGVETTQKDWAALTAASESSWGAGVTAAMTEKRFSKGVNKATTAKWKQNTMSKGVNRWGSGVAAAGNDYAAGFAPYRDTIAGLTLPPRQARGNPDNIRRVSVIAAALHDKKVKG